jgi:hypothetical protein
MLCSAAKFSPRFFRTAASTLCHDAVKREAAAKTLHRKIVAAAQPETKRAALSIEGNDDVNHRSGLIR